MIIDNDDINKIQNILCFVDERYNTSYACYRLKNDAHSAPKYVHNYIKDYIPNNKITIDHINGDGLDNRKDNLRLATKSLQARNQNRKNGKFGIKNIHLNKWNTYSVEFIYYKKRYRGVFKTLEQAKEWLNNKRKEIIPENELLIQPNKIEIEHINSKHLDNKKNSKLTEKPIPVKMPEIGSSKTGIKNIYLNKWNTYNVEFTYNKKRYRNVFKTLEQAKEWLTNKKKEIIPEI